MENNNFPCICGHDRSNHNMQDNYSVKKACYYPNLDIPRALNLFPQLIDCPCNWFKLDNLKYLEQKYEKNLANSK